VSGEGTFGALTVSGQSTLASAVVSTTLNAGATTLSGLTVTNGTTLGGTATIAGDVSLGSAGSTYFSANPDLFVKGNIETDGTLYGQALMLSSGKHGKCDRDQPGRHADKLSIADGGERQVVRGYGGDGGGGMD